MVFWDRALKSMYFNSNAIPQSFLEVGAGQGANLIAIQKVFLQVEKAVDLYAIEVNEKAREKLKEINNVKVVDDLVAGMVDCVFTMGVLIHIHPAHIKSVMRDIYKATKRWIICAEYFAPTTRALPYRGEADALWLDDYGSHWLDNHPLRVVSYGFLWKRISGLDNLNFWILEKTQ